MGSRSLVALIFTLRNMDMEELSYFMRLEYFNDRNFIKQVITLVSDNLIHITGCQAGWLGSNMQRMESGQKGNDHISSISVTIRDKIWCNF